jgi:hypothetical protein
LGKLANFDSHFLSISLPEAAAVRFGASTWAPGVTAPGPTADADLRRSAAESRG